MVIGAVLVGLGMVLVLLGVFLLVLGMTLVVLGVLLVLEMVLVLGFPFRLLLGSFWDPFGLLLGEAQPPLWNHRQRRKQRCI